MYTREDNLTNTSEELSNYIEGYDVFNSKLLYEISKPDIERQAYTIKVYEKRPDLIAKDFYGSDSYLGFIILQGGSDLSNYTVGSTIYLIPKTTLNNLITNINI